MNILLAWVYLRGIPTRRLPRQAERDGYGVFTTAAVLRATTEL